MNSPERILAALPRGSVLSICGAGGKTGLVHELRDGYRLEGKRVLVTTTAHMMNEGNLCSGPDAVIRSLDGNGYAFAGRTDPVNSRKIISLSEDGLREAAARADIVLIEADGARHMLFKVPYPHEPVISPLTTHIAVVYSRGAEGRRISECTYNAEGAAEVLGVSTDAVLTREMIHRALRETYFDSFEKMFPGIPVYLVPRG